MTVSVTDFGAIGDGKTDCTLAIQRAIDTDDEIHVPDCERFYRVSGYLNIGGTNQRGGKRLIGHRPCRGGGPVGGKTALIQGEGNASVFKALGGTTQNRAIELIGLSASNRKLPVLVLSSGVDSSIDNCWFVSTECVESTVAIRDSYGVTIEESAIGCSGGGWAVTAYQQCNALRVIRSRIGGGDLGGGIHVEQSGSVQLENNIFEIGVYGIVIGSNIRLDRPSSGQVIGAGACTCPTIRGNYFEQVRYPVVLGSGMGFDAGSAVFCPVITSNQIGNGGDYPLITLGRITGGTIENNRLWQVPTATKPPVWFTNAPGGSIPYATNNAIHRNSWVIGKAAFYGFIAPNLERQIRPANLMEIGVIS